MIGWLLGLACIASSAAAVAPSDLTPRDLRCEYLVDPMGIEETAPRLSWTLQSPRRAERQSAWQLLVASSPEILARDRGDLWDSSKVATSQTAHIEYAGVALTSRQTCHWKVRAWDRDDQPGPWSAPARWEMGLMSPGDWSAKWVEARATPVEITIDSAKYETIDGTVSKDVAPIVARLLAEHGSEARASNQTLGGDPARDIRKRLVINYRRNGASMRAEIPENAAITLPASQLPYLRKTFSIASKIRSARLFTTALGVYELRLNGQRVGDQYLAPGWTDYNKRVRYQVYDVTAQLQQGRNVLGAIVAPGWFSGHAGLFNAVEFYGKVPALLTQLEITSDDGSIQRIISDESWKSHPGPLLQADLLKGVTYDANLEVTGWDVPEFDDSAWKPATTREETRTLQADIAPPVRILRELPAKSLTEPAPGRWTFDLGQNMVGVVLLKVRADRGTVITLRHGEVLNPDGTIYTENLRGATSTDVYICSGEGVETWLPRFTFHGFRYLEVTGLHDKPDLEAVTGIVLGSDLPVAGEFECSDPRINQLQSNIIWGMHGNYLSIPTDCPQRDERMGWMADAQVFLPTAAYNADIAAFMGKWMIDITDAQREDGAHCDVAPAMKGLSYGTPAWADAGVIVPWVLYQTYGDRRILERNIDSMMGWVQWCKAHSTNLIRDRDRGNDYGDWLSIKADTPKDLLGTAYFAHAADIVSQALAVLGRQAESDEYRRLYEDILAAFVAKYVAADGRMTGDTQTDYILALQFGLLENLPLGDRVAIEHLVNDIAAKDNHLSTGFVGVSHLLQVLTDYGRSDVAYRLLMQDTFPSWLFPVKHGATTIWERWDGWRPETGVHPDASMNSFNHYALGSCGRWLYEGIAGIRRDPDSIAFDRIIIEPRIGGGLTYARATFRSMHGEIASAWKIDHGRLLLDVSIPVNTSATLHLPTPSDRDVLESGQPLAQAEGVNPVRKNGSLTVEVGSGTYSFSMPYP